MSWSRIKLRLRGTDGVIFDGEAEGGGGGGGGGSLVVTKLITSPEILDLANTPVTLIPGVAGNIIVVAVPAVVTLLAGGNAYTDPGGNMQIRDTGNDFIWVDFAPGGFWDSATSGTFTGLVTSDQGPSLTTDVEGRDIVLAYTGGVSPAGGDGILLVTLSYFLAPVA